MPDVLAESTLCSAHLRTVDLAILLEELLEREVLWDLNCQAILSFFWSKIMQDSLQPALYYILYPLQPALRSVRG